MTIADARPSIRRSRPLLVQTLDAFTQSIKDLRLTAGIQSGTISGELTDDY